MSYKRVKVGDPFQPSAKLTNDTIDLLVKFNKNKELSFKNKDHDYNLLNGFSQDNIEANSFVSILDIVEYNGDYYTEFSTSIDEITNVLYVTSDVVTGNICSAVASGVIIVEKAKYENIKDFADNLCLLIEGDDVVVLQLSSSTPTKEDDSIKPFTISHSTEDTILISKGYYNINGVKFGTTSETRVAIQSGLLVLHTEIVSGIISTPYFKFDEPSVNDFPIGYIDDDYNITSYNPVVANFMFSRLCPMAKIESSN